ncbi:MAG: ABC transporter permease [Chloroflexi bacterium]|nr:ABC transporter permease [Chloroflexota bacterium]
MRERARALLLLPAGVWYALFLVGPLVVLFIFSFGIRGPNGGYLPGFTLEQYQAIGTRITPFVNTVWYAALGTIGCLVVAYPLAYYLATRAGSKRLILLALVVVPLWTSFLIRTYAWMFILGSNGIPKIWDELGLGRLVLVNTPFAIVLGIVYNYLPLMILPLFVSLDRLDRSLLEGSRDLGAGPVATFRQITLPLSLPGIASGCLLVFIPAMGEYLIPVLLGGGKTYFLGNALADLFLQSRNWPFGSAIGSAFVGMMLIVVALYAVFTARLSRHRPDAQLL